MALTINAVHSDADRDRALERVAELAGCLEQSPEEVELIMLILALEVWELRARIEGMPVAILPSNPGNATARRQLRLHQSRRRLRCVPSPKTRH